MTKQSSFNRRELGLIAANVGIAALASSALGIGQSVWAQDKTKVLLGNFPSANQINFSKATGSMQKAMGDKVNVEYVGVASGGQILTAMAGNSMDLCNIGCTPMAVGIANGLPVSMVYMHKALKDDECLIVRKDAGIKTLGDLKGKKIGCPFNTSVHFALIAGLKTVGLTASDVKLINLKGDGILPAWQRKDIDAAYIWNPVLGKLTEADGIVIFTTGDLVATGTAMFDAIVVRDAFKESHPDLVLAYLKELNRINLIYREKPTEVADVLSPYLQLPREVPLTIAKQTYTITPQEMLTDTWMGEPGSKTSGVARSLAAQAEFLKEADQIRAVPPDFSKFVDNSFVAKMV